MIFPPKSSIDAWEKLGNKGWDWETLSPYYQKFHKFNPPSDTTAEALATSYIDETIHEKSGPIQAAFPEFHGPLGKAWPETFKNLNYTVTADPLSGQSVGGYSYLSSVNPDNWERSHAGSAYYAPVADRPNLHLLTESKVEKIILEKLNGTDLTATGVQFIRHDVREVRSARKEVILCAGVFQSPQLLELSGVGSPELLKLHGIDVLVENSSVGENLQDHAMTGVSLEVVDGLPTVDMIRDPQVIQAAMQAYQTARAGPLTSTFHSMAIMPVVDFLSDEGRLELTSLLDTHLPASSKSEGPPSQSSQHALIRSTLEAPNEGSAIIGMGACQFHFEKSLQKDIFAITDAANYMTFLVALSRPFSRGSVHVGSASALDPPVIDPRYLSHPLDVEILSRHMQYIPTIARTQPLVSLVKDGGCSIPGKFDVSTLDSAKEHCKRNLITNNHPCGTCPMLPHESGGVVNDRLRVYGVKGLRVVDASVFPMIPGGNIQSSVYAVAERAADLIREDWA